MIDKNKLIKVFNKEAIFYDKYRPKYPEKVIEIIINKTNLNSNSKIIEVGCGTGQITIPFAKKDFSILALEIGKSLAKIAQENLKKYTNAVILNQSFEAWCSKEEKFDLLLSAQAFHWIDPNYGLNKTLKVLKKGGKICLVWNIDISQNTDFWLRTLIEYEKYFPKTNSNGNLGNSKNIYESTIEKSKDFIGLEIINYEWSKDYTKEEYIGLLKTFSDHGTLSKQNKDKFFKRIEEIIDEFNGKVTRNYNTKIVISTKL